LGRAVLRASTHSDVRFVYLNLQRMQATVARQIVRDKAQPVLIA